MRQESKKIKGKQKAEDARSKEAFQMAQEEFRNLGQRIAKIRKGLEPKMTQQILADRIDISYHYLSKIERGGARPSMETICEIALVLGVRLKDLFSDPTAEGWELHTKVLSVELINKEKQIVIKKFNISEEK